MQTPFDVNFHVYAQRIGLDNYMLTAELKRQLISVLVQCGYSSDETVLSRHPTFGAVAYTKARQDGHSHGLGVIIAYIASKALYKVNNESKPVDLAVIEASESFMKLESFDMANIMGYVSGLINLMLASLDEEYSKPTLRSVLKNAINNSVAWWDR